MAQFQLLALFAIDYEPTDRHLEQLFARLCAAAETEGFTVTGQGFTPMPEETDPEPKAAGWTLEQQAAALREGWGVFYNADTKRLEIQRDDEAEIFDGDVAAMLHVLDRAKAGSALHLAAQAALT